MNIKSIHFCIRPPREEEEEEDEEEEMVWPLDIFLSLLRWYHHHPISTDWNLLPPLFRGGGKGAPTKAGDPFGQKKDQLNEHTSFHKKKKERGRGGGIGSLAPKEAFA